MQSSQLKLIEVALLLCNLQQDGDNDVIINKIEEALN